MNKVELNGATEKEFVEIDAHSSLHEIRPLMTQMY